MSGNTEQAARPVRSLPAWAWVIAVIFFPFGTFIALAAARALRWWAALPLALGSYVTMLLILGFGGNPNVPHREESCRLLGFLLFYVAVGQLQYSIGRKRDLWSWQARRIWWIFGILAIAFIVLLVMTMALQVFMDWRGIYH